MIGVDKEGLDAQLEEQSRMQEMENARTSSYAKEMIKNDKLGVLYQERQERDVRDLQKVNSVQINYKNNILINQINFNRNFSTRSDLSSIILFF